MNIIDTVPEGTRAKFLFGALAPIQLLLSAQRIEEWCREAGHTWRERHWGPAATLFSCIWKQAEGVASARAVEDWKGSLDGQAATGRHDGHDFCAARSRLPLLIFLKSLCHIGVQASEKAAWCFKGMPIWLIDGTTFSAPRTAANRSAFGHSANGHKESCLPLVRMLALVCAGSGAVLDALTGPYAMSEMMQLRLLLQRLEAGGLLVMDRGFASFMVFWLAQQRGCQVLTQHHQTRKARCQKRLGAGDTLRIWQRPSRYRITWPDLLSQTPKEITVRVIERTVVRKGYRNMRLKLSTTLLDPKLYLADDLVVLYLQRWNIEVDFRTIKSGYRLQRLTGQTPGVVVREIYAGLIAYNAVRALMARSCEQPRNLSHEQSRRLLNLYAEHMAFASTIRRLGMLKELIRAMAATKEKYRLRPPQPRQIILRPTRYAVLTITRAQWRERYHVA